MERLTGRTKDGTAFAKPTDSDFRSGILVLYGRSKYDYSHLIERLAEYEDAEESGALVWDDSKKI